MSVTSNVTCDGGGGDGRVGALGALPAGGVRASLPSGSRPVSGASGASSFHQRRLTEQSPEVWSLPQTSHWWVGPGTRLSAQDCLTTLCDDVSAEHC